MPELRDTPEILILKGIPLVPRRYGHARLPFSKMEIGDAFRLDEQSPKGANAVRNAARRYPPRKFAVRLNTDGKWYCWRIE